MTAEQRLKSVFDAGEYTVVTVPPVAQDPLKFRDGRRYSDRLKDAKAKTEMEDAVLIGEGRLDNQPVVAAAQDFDFMAGSLGMAAGEAVITGMLRAVERRSPSFFLQPRAAPACRRHPVAHADAAHDHRRATAAERGLTYIVVLTDPNTGGVTASYAIWATSTSPRPGALICFAGPRVIQQTIREQLPEGFSAQSISWRNGMIDMVVHRHQLTQTFATLLRILRFGATAGRTSRRTSR